MTPRHKLINASRPAVSRPFRSAVVLAIGYVVVCTAYIVFSGQIAAAMAGTTEELEAIERVKGVAFIVVTGGLLFAISYLQWRRIQRQEETIIAHERSLVQSEMRSTAAMSAGAIAHDLNNLLLALNGLMEQLKDREVEDDSLSTLRGQLESAIGNLGAMTGRLAAAATQAVEEDHEPVQLDVAVRQLIDAVRAHPDLRRVRIVPAELAGETVELDRTLFEQCVLNLLINAGQAAGPSGQVEVRLTRHANELVLQVHDSGPGVPSELMTEIFVPSYTTKDEGTGIGLLVVKAFARSCGGSVSVSESPLGGALFQVRIPDGARSDGAEAA